MNIVASADLRPHLDPAMAEAHADATISWVDGQPPGRDIAEPEVLVFSPEAGLDPAVMGELGPALGASSLRWFQSPGAGADHPVFASLLERGVRVTTSAGVHAEPIAQYVFAHILYLERDIETHRRLQLDTAWEPQMAGDLTAKTIGIVGVGGIGAAVARIGRAFGMRVMGIARSTRRSSDVDELLSPDRLHILLAASDYVVLSVPLTAATYHLIGADQLAAMKPTAVLVNVARGDVVDEAALVQALDTGVIGGAVVDVAAQEPLPADAGLWTARHCIVTPHDSARSPNATSRVAALFLDNLARYRAGEALRNELTTDQL